MKYKVGDKVRVRGDLSRSGDYKIRAVSDMEKFRGRIGTVEKITEEGFYELNIDVDKRNWTDEMLRPAEFKIWCETEAEKQAVREELEKEGYVWCNGGEKPTKVIGDNPKCGLFIKDDRLSITYDKKYFNEDGRIEFTPSEFTGIDFSEKIIITKTPTGATATYGNKTVTAEGDFEDASRQALAEVLCPFEVGDRVQDKRCKNTGTVKEIRLNGDVVVYFDDGDYGMVFSTLELLEPYTEPEYNAKLFCVPEAYEKGLSDARECVGKLKDKDIAELHEIFDSSFTGNVINVLMDFAPQEVAQKLKAWEERQEIKVGDVVKIDTIEAKHIVTLIDENTLHCVNAETGGVICVKKDRAKKTGKHVDLTEIFKGLEG